MLYCTSCSFIKREFGDKSCPPTINPLEVEAAEISDVDEAQQEDEGGEGKTVETCIPADPLLLTEVGSQSLKEAVRCAEGGETKEARENGAAETAEADNPDVIQKVEESRSPQGITAM